MQEHVGHLLGRDSRKRSTPKIVDEAERVGLGGLQHGPVPVVGVEVEEGPDDRDSEVLFLPGAGHEGDAVELVAVPQGIAGW